MSKNCCNECYNEWRDEWCDEKDRDESLNNDDFIKIEKEVNDLIKVASDGYIAIDYEVQKLSKKLGMLLDFLLSIYALDEEERTRFERIKFLL